MENISSCLIVLTFALSYYYFVYKPTKNKEKRRAKKEILAIIKNLGSAACLENIQTELAKKEIGIKISKTALYKILMKMDEKNKLIARKDGYYVLTEAGETKLKKTIRIKEENEEESV